MFSVPIESLRRKDCSKRGYLVLLLLPNYIYCCGSFRLRYFSRKNLVVLVFLCTSPPPVYSGVQCSAWALFCRYGNWCMQFCWFFFSASVFLMQRLSRKSSPRCHHTLAKAVWPQGSWEVWCLLWLCHLPVRRLWTVVHSLICSSNTSWTIYCAQCPGPRQDVGITKMNGTLSLFLRNFLFRV